MKPLKGTVVVDLTHALAGPFCTHQLALLGAEVIKVERPDGGDDFRGRVEASGYPSVFIALNADKRSLCLDLKAPEAKEVLHRLIRRADILVENFRPGVTEDLGLDWETLKGLNSRLIYCSISGFGQTGPLRDMPAVEWSVQAMSGMTSLYVSESADPMDLGVSVLDPYSGYMAFAAILAALLERARTNQGQRIDAGMMDAGFVLMSAQITEALLSTGRKQPRRKRATMARYRTADGWMFIGALHDKWFETLCRELDAPELLVDERFKTVSGRAGCADELYAELARRIEMRSGYDLERKLTAAGMPAAVVRSLSETATSTHAAERGLLLEVDMPGSDRKARVVGCGFRSDEHEPGGGGRVPLLGEQSDEVLLELGYSAPEIGSLRAAGVI